MQTTIRMATADDAQAVAGLLGTLFAELSPEASVDERRLLDTVKGVMAMPSVSAVLAERGGRAVGLAMLNECAAVYAGGTFGEITELVVLPQARSRGIAAQILGWCADLGRTRGWTRIEVGAPEQPAWGRTLAFYRREGFVEVGPRLKRQL